MNKKIGVAGAWLLGIFAFSLIALVIPGLAGALGEFLVLASDKYFDLPWQATVLVTIFMGACLYWFFVGRKNA